MINGTSPESIHGSRGRDEEGINVMVRSAVVKLVASFVVVVAAMRCCGETVDATVWCGDHSGFNVVDAIQRLEHALADSGLKMCAIETMTAHKYDDGRQWSGIAIVSRADATTGVRKWFAVKDSRRVELRNEPDRPEKILPLSKAASVSLDAAWELCGMEGICVDRVDKLYVEEFAKGFPWFSAETNTFLTICSDDKDIAFSHEGNFFDVFVDFPLDHVDAIHRTVGSDDYSKGLRSGVFAARRRLRSALKDEGFELNFIQRISADDVAGTNRWLGVAAVTRPGTTNMVGMGFAIHASRRIELTGVRELPDGSDVPQGSFLDILKACSRARIDADSIVGVEVRRQQQDEFIARYERLLRYVYHNDKSPVDHWVWTVTTTNGTMKIDATRNRESTVYVRKRVPRQSKPRFGK